MAQKNVILISIDDMRTPDDWGHFTPLISTPNIDRLMGEGTTFERAITQVPLCNPSRTSVMTGRQPSETGVLNNETRWFERVDPFAPLHTVSRDERMALIAVAGRLLRANLRPGRRRTVPDGLAVYGRNGRPCRRCGTRVRRHTEGELARVTYWCPACQPSRGAVGRAQSRRT